MGKRNNTVVDKTAAAEEEPQFKYGTRLVDGEWVTKLTSKRYFATAEHLRTSKFPEQRRAARKMLRYARNRPPAEVYYITNNPNRPVCDGAAYEALTPYVPAIQEALTPAQMQSQNEELEQILEKENKKADMPRTKQRRL